jgi:uncharacterized membrane protein
VSHDAPDELRRLVAGPIRIGGVVAVLVIAVGLVLDIGRVPDVRHAAPKPLFDLVASGESAVIGIGLFLLALVPLAMIVGAIIGFARSGERRYLAASLLVAALLLASIIVPAILLS